MVSTPRHFPHHILGVTLALGFVAIAQLPGRAAPQAAIRNAPPAELTLAGETVLQLRTTVGKLTPRQRMDIIEGRLARILAIPRLQPSDVAVYTPPGKPPVIYAVGRKLITMDAATADAGTGETALELAVKCAKRLQQLLPLVDYRLPDDSEPVLPADPPLTITADQTQVGGQVADVMLGKTPVIQLIGVQNGVTAVERADVVSDRLAMLLHRCNRDPNAVSVADGEMAKVTVPIPVLPQLSEDRTAQTPDADSSVVSTGSDQTVKTPATVDGVPVVRTATLEGPTAQIKIGDTALITVTSPDAIAGGQPNPKTLAQLWADNIRSALAPAASRTTPTSFELMDAAAPETLSSAAPAPAAPAKRESPEVQSAPDSQESPTKQDSSAGGESPSAAPMDTVPRDSRLRMHSPLRTRIARRLAV